MTDAFMEALEKIHDRIDTLEDELERLRSLRKQDAEARRDSSSERQKAA